MSAGKSAPSVAEPAGNGVPSPRIRTSWTPSSSPLAATTANARLPISKAATPCGLVSLSSSVSTSRLPGLASGVPSPRIRTSWTPLSPPRAATMAYVPPPISRTSIARGDASASESVSAIWWSGLASSVPLPWIRTTWTALESREATAAYVRSPISKAATAAAPSSPRPPPSFLSSRSAGLSVLLPACTSSSWTPSSQIEPTRANVRLPIPKASTPYAPRSSSEFESLLSPATSSTGVSDSLPGCTSSSWTPLPLSAATMANVRLPIPKASTPTAPASRMSMLLLVTLWAASSVPFSCTRASRAAPWLNEVTTAYVRPSASKTAG